MLSESLPYSRLLFFFIFQVNKLFGIIVCKNTTIIIIIVCTYIIIQSNFKKLTNSNIAICSTRNLIDQSIHQLSSWSCIFNWSSCLSCFHLQIQNECSKLIFVLISVICPRQHSETFVLVVFLYWQPWTDDLFFFERKKKGHSDTLYRWLHKLEGQNYQHYACFLTIKKSWTNGLKGKGAILKHQNNNR